MRLFALLLLPALAFAAILPETIGPYQRGEVKPAAVSDQPLWDEYGLRDAETAQYAGQGRTFSAAAYRLLDTTNAMAAGEWQRSGNVYTHGNYLLVFDGYNPSKEELDAVYASLPKLEMAPPPTLPGYLPSQNLVKGSERYVVGPVGLEKFEPGIPPSVAAFHMGAEAQIGTFTSPKGDMKLAIFNYPTPQIAMQRLEAFNKLPGAMAKRSGPLVAVLLSPPDPDAAERLLSRVRYQAEITLSERVATRRDNIGDLVINAFILIGILLCFALVGGIAVGGVRVLFRSKARGAAAEPMILLHLQDR